MLGSSVHTYVPIACPARRLHPVLAYQPTNGVFIMGLGSHLPGHEANRFNNSRLDDLLSWEDTPGNGVWPLTVRVRSQVAALVNCIVRYMWVTFDLCQ